MSETKEYPYKSTLLCYTVYGSKTYDVKLHWFPLNTQKTMLLIYCELACHFRSELGHIQAKHSFYSNTKTDKYAELYYADKLFTINNKPYYINHILKEKTSTYIPVIHGYFKYDADEKTLLRYHKIIKSYADDSTLLSKYIDNIKQYKYLDINELVDMIKDELFKICLECHEKLF